MKNFMSTILSAFKDWTKTEIKDSTADWNQNDSSANNYVKNRTHWTDDNGVVHTLDEKYISDSIARVEDIPEINYPVTSVNGMTGDVVINIPEISNAVITPTTAQVGQTIVVKSVDENGKPTEWEAQALPEGVPVYTSDDEGKFLRIVNGIPTWVSEG